MDYVAALRAGDVVIMATDTVYGLVAAADDSKAVAQMFALKNRPIDARVAVLVADVAQAAHHVALGPTGARLADAFWPGPLTLVAPRHVIGSLAAGDDDSLGVRCPDDETVRALAAAVGPLAATSANIHGGSTATSARDATDLFPSIGLVLDGGPRPGRASTVVSLMGDEPEVLREGSITAADIEVALRRDS